MENVNVFESHSKENETQAKVALVEVAATVIGKYVIAQERLNAELSGGQTPKGSDAPCLQCKVNKLTKLMARLDLQIGQIAKTYELLFDEELDTKTMTKVAAREFYPLVSSTSPSPEFSQTEVIERVLRGKVVPGSPSRGKLRTEIGIDFPEGTPQEVKDIASMIKTALNKEGKNPEFKIMDVTGASKEIFGLDPKDYPDFKSFWAAVQTKKKESKDKSKSSDGSSTDSPAHTESHSHHDSGSEGAPGHTAASAEVVKETIHSTGSPSSNGSSTKPGKDSDKDSKKH